MSRPEDVGPALPAAHARPPLGAAALIETALRQNRALAAALLGAVVLAWVYLFLGAGMDMGRTDAMFVPMGTPSWSWGVAAAMLVMWGLMMAAMMLPSAAPMLLLYAAIARRHQSSGRMGGRWAAFAGGYLAVWSGFAVGAVALQFLLTRAGFLSPAMALASAALAGAVLVGAGVYQWTPWKGACLRHCRSPLDFVLTHWRNGTRGAFAMGLRHGGYCLGCCWVLMLLLFVVGVMNLAAIGGLALFVLIEKFAPAGGWIGRLAGLGLAIWGVAVLGAL